MLGYEAICAKKIMENEIFRPDSPGYHGIYLKIKITGCGILGRILTDMGYPYPP